MKSILAGLLVILMLSSVNAIGECEICEFSVSEVETLLASNASETTIESYVDKLCMLYPTYDTICENAVNYYLPIVIEKLEMKYTPLVVCQDIGLCANGTRICV